MVGEVLGAPDDSRFSEGRKPQRLRLVELWILECGAPDKPIDQRIRQPFFGDEEHVCRYDFDPLRHGARDS